MDEPLSGFMTWVQEALNLEELRERQRWSEHLQLVLSLRQQLDSRQSSTGSPHKKSVLRAAVRMLTVLEEIIQQNTSHGKPYFIFGLSEKLNRLLFEQIFHLDSKQDFRELICRQIFSLNPQTLKMLSPAEQNKRRDKLTERFESSFQAIEVCRTGTGRLRGMKAEVQRNFFTALEVGLIQRRVYPDEANPLLKSELDQDLEAFGRLLQRYLNEQDTETEIGTSQIKRAEQLHALLIDIYTYPFFLIYQYYRSLLDFAEIELPQEKINLTEQASQVTEQQLAPQTGDRDLDTLLGDHQGGFVRWPTGKDAIYTQEQYPFHFITGDSLQQLQTQPQPQTTQPLMVFVFDVSGSMLAPDVKPSRFEFALDLQESLAQQLPEAYSLAQVVFSSKGIVSQVFGLSREAFLRFLQGSRRWFFQARQELLKDMFGLTSLGAGVLSGVSLIEQTRSAQGLWGMAQPAEIILLSDGDHNFPPNHYPAARYAMRQNIPVHTVCCAREMCVELENNRVEALSVLVDKEAKARARKWKTWYPNHTMQEIIQKQRRIVLDRIRHKLQHDLHRSAGVFTEPLQMIAELSGGHYFSGAFNTVHPNPLQDILDLVNMRMQLRERVRELRSQS